MQENARSGTCCCCGCGQERESQLLERVRQVARDYKGREGCLIQVLHMAQSIYGYLPLEVHGVVADELAIPVAQVSGGGDFYSFFSTQPRGKHTIRVCPGHRLLRPGRQEDRGSGSRSCWASASGTPPPTVCLPLRWPGASAPAAWRRHVH